MSATLENWRTPPHNIWAFHNIEKLIPVHTISKPDKSSPLKSSPKSFDGFSIQSNESKLDLPSFLSYTNTDGFVILHKGEMAYEYYANDNNASSKHIMMSMSKSVTGLIAGILSSQGKLDLSAQVKKYVPSVSDIYDGVTVQELLDMRSGVKAEDDRHEYRAASGFKPFDGGEEAKTLHSFIEKLQAEVNDSKDFVYSSVNTDLLGWVLEAATGQKLAELISELLWRPMGAENDAMITVDAEGSARAAGGMCATVRDIARIGQLLADGGRDVVPKSWIGDMLHSGSTEAWSQGTFAAFFKGVFGGDATAYRDCWYSADVDENGKESVLMAVGIFGQQLMIDLEHDIVMAKTSSMEMPMHAQKARLQTEAFREVRRVLLG
ncbi:hypothetical protein LTR17_014130 [Elasticomyces elasticus]|nr:hypothetical protein LTR17_014130 [Elasticomyces elasticus]